jgi:hypothetical protein
MTQLLHLSGKTLTTNAKVQRVGELVMLRDNATLPRLYAANAALTAEDFGVVVVRADGCLTAWGSNKPGWPTQSLGPQDKAVRRVLERANDGHIDQSAVQVTLRIWPRQRSAYQRR